MTKLKNSIVLGLMCLALTCGIFLQIRTVENSNVKVSQNYEENNLRAEVLKFKEKYDNELKQLEKAESELEKERENSTQNNADLEDAEISIKKANKMIGLSEVKGPGVIVTLKDSQKNTANVMNVMDVIVHDIDILSVINELKNAGAEAISINDQRVVTTSAILCDGNVVRINKEKVGVPFVIKAIGLPESLAALERPGGYLEYLRRYDIEASLEKSNDITIPKYTGKIEFNYAKNLDK
ncbi:MAG: DUF881 domain-containing protein [Clostridia bacterium]|nr:DUF881 domain-containing protein [Clostridia bacterium]